MEMFSIFKTTLKLKNKCRQSLLLCTEWMNWTKRFEKSRLLEYVLCTEKLCETGVKEKGIFFIYNLCLIKSIYSSYY